MITKTSKIRLESKTRLDGANAGRTASVATAPWLRRITAGLVSTALTVLALTGAATPAIASQLSPAKITTVSTASAQISQTAQTSNRTGCSAHFYDDDRRLGPESLPKRGLVGLELIGYHRTGDLTPAAFLSQYYDPTLYGGTGGWIYPPQNGYQLKSDGTPVEWQQQLVVGQPIDRFGSEYGSFLSPTGLPYFTRAIPPSNLDGTPPGGCNYHDYQVLKPFTVDAGPIAAWFAQSGGGLQYQLDATLVPGAPSSINVLWLVTNGYLKRLI